MGLVLSQRETAVFGVHETVHYMWCARFTNQHKPEGHSDACVKLSVLQHSPLAVVVVHLSCSCLNKDPTPRYRVLHEGAGSFIVLNEPLTCNSLPQDEVLQYERQLHLSRSRSSSNQN